MFISLQNQIQAMDGEALQDFALQVLDNQPGLVFNLLAPIEHQPGGYHPAPEVQSPEWCSCRNCRQMPTERERQCCGQQPTYCISRLEASICALYLHVPKEV